MMRRIRWSLSRFAGALRAIAGVPDYGRYLAHMRARHPGDRIMSESEFNYLRLSDRYNRVGSKCC